MSETQDHGPSSSPSHERQFVLRLPAHLLGALNELADSNGRSINAELLSAVRRHLAAPPAVIETIPPLPADPEPPSGKSRKRPPSRPFSGGWARKGGQEDDDGEGEED